MLPKLNVLMSYPYMTKDAREYLEGKDPGQFRLIVDSGAYSAWTKGRRVDLKEYVSFLKNLPTDWDLRTVQLDVIGNPEATYANWQTMLSAGLSDVMPVFTRGADPGVLEEFYKFAKVIMFGGIVKGEKNREYIKWFTEQNNDRPVHWLGFVDVPFLLRYRPYSVDSSAISTTQRYSRMSYYMGGGVLSGINRVDFTRAPKKAFLKSTRARGFTTDEIRLLGEESKWHGGARTLAKGNGTGFASFVSFAHHVYRAIDVERNIGTRIYLAFATKLELEASFDAYDLMKERGTLV